MGNKPLQVFIGYDHRQPVSYNVLQQSILRNSSKPVSITPICLWQLPFKRQGLTPFTFSRFLVPWICDYQGWALFLDIDMLVKGDISKLFELSEDQYTVMVSKNEKRFEWASAILFNCEKNKILTPEYVEKKDGLHQISWCPESEIGDFPRDWNHLVGYDKRRSYSNPPKLIHYTQGIPAFDETIDCEFSKDWNEELELMNGTWPWENLMGNSVHAVVIDGKKQPRYKAEPPQ